MRKIFSFLVGVIVTASMISCSSDDNNDNSTLDDNFKNRSLVKSINTTATYPMMFEDKHKISLSYDASGNLQSIVHESTNQSSNEIKYENYNWTSNNCQVEYYTSLDNAWSTQNFVRNLKGYVTSGEITNKVFDIWMDDILSSTQPYDCLYNEKNQVTQINTIHKVFLDTIPVQTKYTWQRGNIIAINKVNHLYEFEYYTDKKETRDVGLKYLPVTSFHYISTPDHLSGWYYSLRAELYAQNPMFLSKNLLKKYFDGYTTIEYSYDFDSRGRVIRQTQIFTYPETIRNPDKVESTYKYFD
jgi:hypothetical protein